MTTWVLVHSPLVGPMTWEPVAGELRRRGEAVQAPDVGAGEEPGEPFWRYHAGNVARALDSLPVDEPVVFAGHSGAGPLLPAIAAAAGRPVAAYLLVDAGLPADGLRPGGDGQFGEYLGGLYAAGDRFPNWTDEALREVVPDPDTRARLLAALRPRPWSYWEQPIPVPPGWPDAPCACLRFGANPAYDLSAAEAERRGWPSLQLPGAHFHMLVDPSGVAEAMRDLVSRLP